MVVLGVEAKTNAWSGRCPDYASLSYPPASTLHLSNCRGHSRPNLPWGACSHRLYHPCAPALHVTLHTEGWQTNPCAGQRGAGQAGFLQAASPRQLTALLSSAGDLTHLLALLRTNTNMLNPVHISAALVRAARLQDLANVHTPFNSPKHTSRADTNSSAKQQLLQLCKQALVDGIGSGSILPDPPHHMIGTQKHTSRSGADVQSSSGLFRACGVRELANISWALVKLDAGGEEFGPIVLQAVLHLARQPTATNTASPRLRRRALRHDNAPAMSIPAAAQAHDTALNAAAGAAQQHAGLQGLSSEQLAVTLKSWPGHDINLTPVSIPSASSPQPLSHESGQASASHRYTTALHGTSQALVNLLWSCAHWYQGYGTAITSHGGLTQSNSKGNGSTAGVRPGASSVSTSVSLEYAEASEWGVTPVGDHHKSDVHDGWQAKPLQGGALGVLVYDDNRDGNGSKSGRSATHVLMMPGSKQKRSGSQTEKGGAAAPLALPADLEPALEAVSAALLRVLDSASPQDLSLTLWCLSSLQYTPKGCALLPRLLIQLPVSCPDQAPQGLSSIAWGCAQLVPKSQVPQVLIMALETRVLQLLGVLAARPQETTMLMGALANMGQGSPRLWRAVQAQVATAGLQRWPHSCIAGLLGAYAHAHRPCPQLLLSLSQLLSSHQHQGHVPLIKWTSHDMVHLMWAVARLRQEDSKAIMHHRSHTMGLSQLKTAGKDTAQHDVNHSGSVYHTSQLQQTSSFMQGNGQVSAYEGIMLKLSHELSQRLAAGSVISPRSVALAAWAMAACGCVNSGTLAACASHASIHLETYNGAEIAMLVQAQRMMYQASQDNVQYMEEDTGVDAGAGHDVHPQSDTPVKGSAVHTGNDAAWAQLWNAIVSYAPVILPTMRHTELAALCTAAVAAGQARHGLLVPMLQLVLGAVAKRAGRLRQQQLAKAAVGLFGERIRLQPTSITARNDDGHDLHRAADRHAHTGSNHAFLVHNGKPGKGRHLGSLAPKASEHRHMPTLVTAVTLMWALTVAGYRNTHLFTLVVALCEGDAGASRLSPHQLLRLLWATTRAGAYSGMLYHEVGLCLGSHLGTLTPGQLVKALCLFSAARHYDAWLVGSMCMQLRGHMHELDPDELACLMWGIANLNAGVMVQWRPPLGLLKRIIPGMSRHALILTLWSVAMQQHIMLGSETHRQNRPSPRSTPPQSPRTTDHRTPDLQHSASTPDSQSSVLSPAPMRPLPTKATALHFSVLEGMDVLNTLLGRLTHLASQDAASATDNTSGVASTSMPPAGTGNGVLFGPQPHSAQLLGQALSWLLFNGRAGVRNAVAKCMEGMPSEVHAQLQAAWLSAQSPLDTHAHWSQPTHITDSSTQGGLRPASYQGVLGSESDVEWCVRHCATWCASAAAGVKDGGGAPVRVQDVRRELSQILQQMGLFVQLTDRLVPTSTQQGRIDKHYLTSNNTSAELPTLKDMDTFSSNATSSPSSVTVNAVNGSDGVLGKGQRDSVAKARQALPAFCDGLLLLPAVLPGPVAILVAAPHSFARNTSSEPLGPLFTALTILGEFGWRPAVLDSRTWGALQGKAQKKRFTRELLESWRVYLPRDDNDEEEDDKGDEREEVRQGRSYSSKP